MPDQLPASWDDLVRAEALKQGVSPSLALGVLHRESDLGRGPDPAAKSPKGALGLMQLMPDTAQRYQVDPTKPLENIRGGIAHLKYLSQRYQDDIPRVLAAYNAGESAVDKANGIPNYPETQAYVTDVMGRMARKRYATAEQPGGPPQATYFNPKTGVQTPAVPLGQGVLEQVLGGFDPRQPSGRQNIAGGLGAALATALLPEAGAAGLLVRGARLLTPVVGAALGGGAEAGVETGSPTEAVQSGRQQAEQEALGQGLGWLFRGGARRAAAGSVSKSIGNALQEGLDAAKARLAMPTPPPSPSRIGGMVEAVATGPAQAVKDTFGQAVEQAAETGPPVNIAPVKQKIRQAAAKMTPGATATPPEPIQVPTKPRAQMTPEEVAQYQQAIMKATGTEAEPLHPINAVVGDLMDSPDTIPFADAHKFKRLLDDKINWDSPARGQVQGSMQGVRGALRGAMEKANHAPYEAANAAYAPIAKLYSEGIYPKLHGNILAKPEMVVNSLDWKTPTQAKLLKDLTTGVATEGAGAAQGQAAWSALRSSWAYEKLVSKGPLAMAAEMRKMEASGNGREFIDTLFGDDQGKMVWQNMKQIGDAAVQAKADLKTFAKTDLAKVAPASIRRDIAYSVMPGHSITKVGAWSRLFSGPDSKEMLQWVVHSPAATQFFVKHVLTGPDPGVAMTDLLRWWNGGEESPATGQPMPSHEPSGPPMPSSLQR